MANSDYSALKAALKSGNLARCYIFHGEEAYLREYYTRQLRDLICDGPAGDFNYHKLPTEGLTAQAVSDALEAMPVMAERTLVELDDFNLYGKMGEAERERWIELLSDIPDYATLLLVHDTVAWKPDRRVKKLTKAIEDNAQIVEFEKQNTRQLTEWLRRRLRPYGKTIDDATAEYLIFRTGGGMTLLASETDKLASYASAHEITRQDIDLVTEPVLEAQVFAIVDAIAARKGEEALRMLRDLLTMQEEPIPILAAMGSQLRRLYAAKVLQEEGNGVRGLMDLYKLNNYPARKSVDSAARLPLAWCARAVELCAETDIKLKTSYDDSERLLELMVLQLLTEAGR